MVFGCQLSVFFHSTPNHSEFIRKLVEVRRPSAVRPIERHRFPTFVQDSIQFNSSIYLTPVRQESSEVLIAEQIGLEFLSKRVDGQLRELSPISAGTLDCTKSPESKLYLTTAEFSRIHYIA